MSGLIMKDLYNFKLYAKQYLLMLVFFSIFAFPMKSPVYIIFMGTMMGMTYMFSSITLDETGGFAFALMFPVSRKQIIGAKYLIQVAEMLVVIVLTVLLGAAIAIWHKINYMEWIPTTLGAIGGFMLIMSVMIPISLKWKVEKARIIFMGLILVPSGVFFLGMKFLGKEKIIKLLSIMDTTESMFAVLGGFVIVAGICMVISYFISVKIFAKKEF